MSVSSDGEEKDIMFAVSQKREFWVYGDLWVWCAAKTYHDGKWVMLNVSDGSLFSEMQRMLLLKRRPNRKST